MKNKKIPVTWKNGKFKFEPDEYMGGGQIGQYADLAGGVANMIIPGAGAVVSPIFGIISDLVASRSDDKLKLKPSTSIYAKGGSLKSVGPGVATYIGPDHRMGGMMVTKEGIPSDLATEDNVEGGETLVNLGKLGVHIFSKRLKIKA